MIRSVIRAATIASLAFLAGCNSSSSDKPATPSTAIPAAKDAANPVVTNGTVPRIYVAR